MAAFDNLPQETLVQIAQCLVPPRTPLLTETVARTLQAFAAAARCTCSAVAQALAVKFPALMIHGTPREGVAVDNLLRQLAAASSAGRILTSARPWKTCSISATASGLELIGRHGDALPEGRCGASMTPAHHRLLVIFGGRYSSQGETLGDTLFATLNEDLSTVWASSGYSGDLHSSMTRCHPLPPARQVSWRALTAAASPPSRCYHAACSLGLDSRSVVVFGGAGDQHELLNDLWLLQGGSASPDADPRAEYRWKQLHAAEDDILRWPPARSAHVMCFWEAGELLLLHGGLNSDQGPLDDVWLLPRPLDSHGPCSWKRAVPRGSSPMRAHHSAAITGDVLVVVGGQDESLLTQIALHLLDLPTMSWTEVGAGDGVPLAARRIDACAAALPHDLGVLVFGGVDDSFEFCTPGVWRLAVSAGPFRRSVRWEVVDGVGGRVDPRACCSLCTIGPSAFLYGWDAPTPSPPWNGPSPSNHGGGGAPVCSSRRRWL